MLYIAGGAAVCHIQAADILAAMPPNKRQRRDSL
jgi:hypothetical protein